MSYREKTIITHTAEETRSLGCDLAAEIKPGDILCLYGELGAGKTTFLQGFAKGLGISQRIISPTFIIVRTYQCKGQNASQKFTVFYHIDLYRAETLDDLKSIGIEEILSDKNAIVAIEWAEKLGDILPKKRTEIKFEYAGENKRKIITNLKFEV